MKDNPMTKIKTMPLEEVRRTFPQGARVAFYPVRGLPKFEITKVTSEPWMLNPGSVAVKIDGRIGGACVSQLALTTDRQSPGLSHRMANGRVSARAFGKRFRAMIDKLPLHADEAPQGFATRGAATAYANSVRDALQEARTETTQTA